MFRRREDELSADTDTTAGQGSLLGSSYSDSATVVTPERSGSAGSSSAQAASGSAASSSASSTSGTSSPGSVSSAMNSSFQMSAAPLPRPQPQQIPAAPTASAFRTSTVQQPDVSRRAIPETKTPLPASLSQPLANPAAKETRRVLTVGADILLKGEIATCDRLVIEGKVDAVLNDVGTVELAESGSFKGVAQVENAEISGLFEGELIVKGRLVIYSSGKVRGKITYGEIEIERGGEISGEVKNSSSNQPNSRSSRSAKEDKVAA